MRYFRVWGGPKPTTDNKTFTIARGDSRTNPKYWIVSPQTSIVTLSQPAASGASLSSSGTYTVTIFNNGQDDAIFVGTVYFNGSASSVIKTLIPAGGKYVFTKKFSLVSGTNTVFIRAAQFADVGYGLTETSRPPVSLGEATYSKAPTTVTVYIPALQTGISSVNYTYTNASGSSVSIQASRSQKSIYVKPNTTISWKVTSRTGYLCNNNNSSTYSTSQSVSTSSVTLPTMYAKFAKPTQTSHTTSQTSIGVYLSQNTGATWDINCCQVTGLDSNTVIGNNHTKACPSSQSKLFVLAAPCETRVYFRWYMPAQGSVRASDYQWDYWNTDTCSTTT